MLPINQWGNRRRFSLQPRCKRQFLLRSRQHMHQQPALRCIWQSTEICRYLHRYDLVQPSLSLWSEFVHPFQSVVVQQIITKTTDSWSIKPPAGRSMLGMTDSITSSTPRNAQMELSALTPATRPAATQTMALGKSFTAIAVALSCQEARSSWLLFTKRPVTHSQLQYLVCTSPPLVGYFVFLALLPPLKTQITRE